jgi:hypothetical protein
LTGLVTVLVVHAQGDGMCGARGEENSHVVAKTNILSSLTYIEADDGRPLASVATVNSKDLVFNGQA